MRATRMRRKYLIQSPSARQVHGRLRTSTPYSPVGSDFSSSLPSRWTPPSSACIRECIPKCRLALTHPFHSLASPRTTSHSFRTTRSGERHGIVTASHCPNHRHHRLSCIACTRCCAGRSGGVPRTRNATQQSGQGRRVAVTLD
ncbi:hypothetical protein BCV69DRAFT_151469 [Microstroma glucosiphilum]|uniref:Uncharacterized protein n=1 Tax=Pseudomicrostroma glucosiphilum TaxID=1684307 RepID=A0A316UHD7_9BASI|nr:hypothetical protein BCV69DRAFT_151469 [Pseudomicrostroma glucosiphilum]PWN22605.1 hypothetical protein BCV69DRAFT_151469 [Pseudomicrostroma glucosiphilum]